MQPSDNLNPNNTPSSDNNPNTRFIVSENAMMQKLDNELVILDTQNGQYYTLNEVATDIVDCLVEQSSAAQIIEKLLAQYDVDEAELTQDVYETLQYLQDKALVVECE